MQASDEGARVGQYYATWSPVDYRALFMNDAHCLQDK